MRPDESFLGDIVRNADLLMGFVAGISKEAFDQDDILCYRDQRTSGLHSYGDDLSANSTGVGK